jgi:UDP-3-O-[3-hydroxymyristoyl] N-acetylglucosamine deacetylase
MAAFAGCGIDNATIILDGAEVPIMDGSSQHFVEAFQNVGIEPLNAPRQALRILKTIEVHGENGAMARFEPDTETVFDYTIDFSNNLIGRQSMIFTLGSHDDFKNKLANCRTFTRLADVEMLQQAGLIKGGGLDNAVVFDNDRILNDEGIRQINEPVRHKILDAVGDTYLLGMPFIGRFVCEKGGHALTNHLLRTLMADRTATIIVEDRLGIAQPHAKDNMSSTAKLAYKA